MLAMNKDKMSSGMMSLSSKSFITKITQHHLQLLWTTIRMCETKLKPELTRVFSPGGICWAM